MSSQGSQSPEGEQSSRPYIDTIEVETPDSMGTFDRASTCGMATGHVEPYLQHRGVGRGTHPNLSSGHDFYSGDDTAADSVSFEKKRNKRDPATPAEK